MKDPDLMSERELRIELKDLRLASEIRSAISNKINNDNLKDLPWPQEVSDFDMMQKVEEVDPDWRDHFHDIDMAYEFYKEEIES